MDVFLLSRTLWLWMNYEISNRKLSAATRKDQLIIRQHQTTGQINMTSTKESGAVGAAEDPDVLTLSEASFTVVLSRHRQKVTGVVIVLVCFLMMLRTVGIYICDGMFNLSS